MKSEKKEQDTPWTDAARVKFLLALAAGKWQFRACRCHRNLRNTPAAVRGKRMRHEIRNRIQTAGAQGYEGHPAGASRRIIAKAEALRDDLAGDVKKLTNFAPEYRLRVGNYRVLFEVDQGTVTVYRVLHRKDAYS